MKSRAYHGERELTSGTGSRIITAGDFVIYRPHTLIDVYSS